MYKVRTVISGHNGNQRECKRLPNTCLAAIAAKLPRKVNGGRRTTPPAVCARTGGIRVTFLRIRRRKVLCTTLHYSSFYLTDCPGNIIFFLFGFLYKVLFIFLFFLPVKGFLFTTECIKHFVISHSRYWQTEFCFGPKQ